MNNIKELEKAYKAEKNQAVRARIAARHMVLVLGMSMKTADVSLRGPQLVALL